MRVKGDLTARRRQLIESAHRHVDFVADAVHVDDHLRRVPCDEFAADPADQTSLPRFMRNPAVASLPSPCPPCAWQIAHASASAASGLGSPVSFSRRLTMSCTCSLAAWALPTTACFTCNAVYSATGSSCSTAAQIAVPRA